MTNKDAPQENTEDMSIDELSAAIDAHMDAIQKPKSKKKTPKAPAKKTTKTATSAKKEVEDVEEDAKENIEEDAGGTKVAVKHSYVSKVGNKDNTTPSEEESGMVTQTSKVELKPISDQEEEKEDLEIEKEPAAKPAVKKTTMDIMVKKKKPAESTSVAETDEDEPEVGSQVKEDADEEKVDEPDAAEVEIEESDSPVETKEKPVIKTENTKLTPIPKRGNELDELSAQLPDTEAKAAMVPEGEALKTFDTKQYHIPIKASRHHRRGSSFKVFIVVLAAILATVYVLSELEIIDLAALVST